MNRLQRVFSFVFGDGSLRVCSERSKNARLSFHHGPAQGEYLKWKMKMLEELGFKTWFTESREQRYNKANSKYDGKTYFGYHGQCGADRVFTEAWKIAYPDGEKEYNPRWCNPTILDDMAMAIWWMDDGSLSWSKGSATIGGQLHVCATEAECVLVKTVFEVRLGIEVKVHRRRQLYHLYFPAKSFQKLIRVCLPYLHADLLYKCAVLMGEDGKPIIPASAEHLKWHLDGCKIEMKI